MNIKQIFNGLYQRLPTVGRYAEVPAGLIDQMELEDSNSWLYMPRYFLRERILFILFFPLFATLDMVTSFINALKNFVGILFTSDETQDKYIKKTKEYSVLFSKSLLGLLFSFLGVLNPKWISIFFLPQKKSTSLVSGGALYSAEVDIEIPETVEELRALIRKANLTQTPLMALGAGRSQGKQFFPESKGKKGILVDMSNFNEVKIDPHTKTAMLQAGARWVDIQLAANKHKLALKVMQASNVFSVGGSIGTDIHGWDHRNGTLANTIKSLSIITPQGDLVTVLPSSPMFGQILGGFGLFGIVVGVELELIENELLVEKGKKIAIEDYVEYFRSQVQSDDHIRMHLYRLSLDPSNLLGDGIAVNYTTNGKESVKTEKIFREGENGTRMERIMVNVARRFGWARKRYWDGECTRLLETETVMSRNEVMRPSINAMFNNSVSESEWLQEYFLPGENLAAFIAELGQLLTKNEVILLNSSVRFVKKDEHSLLGYAANGDRFAVVLCFNQSLKLSQINKTKKWVRAANDLVIKHGGTFYLPYQQFATETQFEQAYTKERIEKFRQAKNQADPNLVFTSGFYQQHIAKKEEKPNYFKMLMRNVETRKKFSGFLENVLQRVDSDKFYDLLEDILKYKDSHEEIYAELLKRLPDVMPGKISSFKRIIHSLGSIKEDLTNQARALLSGVQEINGLVEIGYPGRFVSGFKSQFKVNGKITAVYEEPSLSDYIQTGFPRPYDEFVKLDYQIPDLSAIKDNSADIVTCYVGLHHFPEQQLENFLKNVKRILREGGRFLLVDHDADTDEAMLMANMAHSVFNAATGVSVEEEMSETRNFHSIKYWKKLLEENGLKVEDTGPEVPMVRQGDPSLNTMLSFVKPCPW